MANEFTYSGTSMRVAALLHQEIRYLLMDPTDLRATMDFIPFSATGSSALTVGQLDRSGAMSAPGEVTQVNATAVTDSSFTLTVAHYSLRHDVSYLAEITAGGNDAGLMEIARKLVGSATLTLTDMAAALFTGLTNSVGSTSVDLDCDDIYDAQFTLHSALVPGPYYCVLYPQQINDFVTSLRGETGAVQFQAATAEMLKLRGPGYQGSWNGVDFWSCDSVPTANAGADSAGAMFGKGAFAYTEAPVSALLPNVPKIGAMDGTRMFVAFENSAEYGMVKAVAHYFPAVAEAEDSRGVKIVTDR